MHRTLIRAGAAAALVVLASCAGPRSAVTGDPSETLATIHARSDSADVMIGMQGMEGPNGMQGIGGMQGMAGGTMQGMGGGMMQEMGSQQEEAAHMEMETHMEAMRAHIEMMQAHTEAMRAHIQMMQAMPVDSAHPMPGRGSLSSPPADQQKPGGTPDPHGH